MKNALTTPSIIAALSICGSIASAAAPTMEVLSADRELFVIACGFDYDFDDCAGARESSQATSGFYDNEIFADLNDYYGNDIAIADGQIYSNITTNRIELEYFADCEVTNSGIYSADAGVYGDTDVEFEFLDDVRVVFEGYAEGYLQSYFSAGASLREVGGPTLASFNVQGAGDDDTQFVGWLYAGTYSVSADFDASAFYSMPSAGELSLSFRVYHKTDFNTDGVVNTADRDAFIAQYRARTAAADYNGDGVTNRADRVSFIADWRAAR